MLTRRRLFFFILLLLLMSGLTSCTFVKKQMVCRVNGFGSRSPVVWYNLKITFPDTIIYRQSNDEIIFLKWDFDGTSLFLKHKTTGSLSTGVTIKRLTNLNCEVLSFEETVILSRPATKIDNIREDGSYNRVILIPERLLWISMTGDKDKFGEYEEIIRGIEVLEVDEGIQAPYHEEPEVLG